MDTKDLLTPRLPFIRTLPARGPLAKEQLCVPELLLYIGNTVEMYYAPFDYLNAKARIVIIGITPGWTQMKESFEVFRDALSEGASVEEAQRRAIGAAAFVGSMRSNLTNMLDTIGVADVFGLRSTRMLFGESRALAQTTSALRYPVFVKEENYKGDSPKPFKHPVLRDYWHTGLIDELRQIEGRPLVVPLGKTVTEMLGILVADGTLQEEQCLLGFPHPSGGNGHRVRLFDERKDELKKVVYNWSAPQH